MKTEHYFASLTMEM